MQMLIDILKVDGPVTKPNKNGSFREMVVNYRQDGKAQTKKLIDFKYKDVFDVLVGAKPDEVFKVNLEKIDGYWTWTAIEKQGASSVSTTSNTAPVAGGKMPADPRETSEERAIKQRSIERQVALQYAINALKVDKTAPDVNTTLRLATAFYEWISEKDSLTRVLEMSNDMPDPE